MIRPLLLDTCACLWLTHGDAMSAESREAIDDAASSDAGIYVSSITAWEVATLVRKRRYQLGAAPAEWFAAFTARSGIRLADLTPEILIASVLLPGDPPADPADRMIAATARARGLTIITRDRPLRAYAAAGLVSLVPC